MDIWGNQYYCLKSKLGVGQINVNKNFNNNKFIIMNGSLIQQKTILRYKFSEISQDFGIWVKLVEQTLMYPLEGKVNHFYLDGFGALWPKPSR